MNFDRDKGNMPELGSSSATMFFWCVVVVIVGGIFIWVKRKRWI